MTEKQIAAVRKLREDNQKEGGNSKYARAVYTAVCDALVGFCEQNEEFADAILQQDKTLGACCEEIMQKCGTSISDLEVYARAVNFYFPGAKIEMKMTIYMSGFEVEARKNQQTSAKILDLKFEDLLDLGGI